MEKREFFHEDIGTWVARDVSAALKLAFPRVLRLVVAVRRSKTFLTAIASERMALGRIGEKMAALASAVVHGYFLAFSSFFHRGLLR